MLREISQTRYGSGNNDSFTKKFNDYLGICASCENKYNYYLFLKSGHAHCKHGYLTFVPNKC
jgi:hypothetical protein